MTQKPRSNPTNPRQPRGVESRRYGRLKDPGVRCSLGPVIDLSAGGVRVLSKHRLKGRVDAVFDTGNGPRLGVRAKIAWCRRMGFRSYLVGLQFEDLPLSSAKRLLRQGSCAVLPSHTKKQQKLPVCLSFATLGVTVLIAGVIARSCEVYGWLDNTPLPQGTGDAVGLATYPLVFVGLFLLAYALLCTMLRPTVAKRTQQATRSRHQSVDRRNPSVMLNSILDSALGGVLILEAIRDANENIQDFYIQTANPAAEQLLGRSEELLVGKRLHKCLPCLASEGLYDMAASVIETGLPHDDQIQLRYDGHWYKYTAVKLGDGLAVTFADISEQQLIEEKLRHAAFHDSLTGLPNRKLLTEHLTQAIHRAERVKGYRFAVLFLDFDRFKIINDSLGHDAGDQLLIGITERLHENLRELDTTARLSDTNLPSRLGGDEFVVLLEGIRDDRAAAVVAQRLLNAFAQPYQIAGHEVTSTASIGIVSSDPRYTSPDSILRDADTAMYQAKSAGKARYVVFDEQMHKTIVDRLTTENELRAAVESNTFQVMYEPIVCLGTGRLKGMEALIRWVHPRRGLIPPAEFIEIAEELNLMGLIGRWVLHQACTDFVKWCTDNPEHPPSFINVNVSRSQLRDPGLVGQINAVILETKIDPSMLRLEITESMVMDDLEKMSEVLCRLKELGLQLAMDDFGTGHSSLTCLHKFPLDVLKIDRSFINSVGRKERHYGAILHSVIELATNLDMQVIAEGIENPNQLALLQGLSCQFGQGWLFSEPVNAQTVQSLLHRDFCRPQAA